MNKPKNYKSEFAKFVNINGKWKYYETEQDYIDLLNEENERLKRENNLLKADIEASQEIISDYKKEEERYKLIIKALEKHFTDLEYYEDNEFLRQLLSVTDNDMIWLKRMAGEENKQ